VEVDELTARSWSDLPRAHFEPSIWDTWAPLKIKLFLWLAIRKRHWMADRRQRHGLEANDLCFLCDQEPKTIDHIVVLCSFAKQVWWNTSSVLSPVQGMATPGHNTGVLKYVEVAVDRTCRRGAARTRSSLLSPRNSGRREMLDASEAPAPKYHSL
jgi:hypothetical protein